QVLFFLAQNRHFSRNLLPVIPPLLLFAAIGVLAAAAGLARLFRRMRVERLRGETPAAWLATSSLALGVAVIAGPLLSAIGLTQFEAQLHSKVRAATYVRDQLPHGAPIAVALNPVQWANQPFVTPLEDITAHDAEWYRRQGYRYLVANLKTVDPERYVAL